MLKWGETAYGYSGRCLRSQKLRIRTMINRIIWNEYWTIDTEHRCILPLLILFDNKGRFIEFMFVFQCYQPVTGTYNPPVHQSCVLTYYCLTMELYKLHQSVYLIFNTFFFFRFWEKCWRCIGFTMCGVFFCSKMFENSSIRRKLLFWPYNFFFFHNRLKLRSWRKS